MKLTVATSRNEAVIATDTVGIPHAMSVTPANEQERTQPSFARQTQQAIR